MRMDDIRFTGSERLILDALALDANEIRILAPEVTAEIRADKYDGYTTPNKALCDAIAGGLATLATATNWHIYADFDEHKRTYRVWVKR